MAQTMRVSLPGYNALTDTNLDHFALHSDDDNILIKEFARGSGVIDYLYTETIPHNLGYVPMYFVYCEVATDVYQIANSFDPVGSGWRSFADTTNLYIRNRYSASFTHYKYYIFYDLIV